ncbi:MAG: hypothetical protein QNJ54_25935 [Prochloraceae cyanobacterium]|nr:hypothetical protein [Prochloraceae cyanobacterium]
MQYTNPLRTKILLYSLIYQKLDNYRQYLSALRTVTLDVLLSKLLYKYNTIEEMESELYTTAKSTIEPDENIQIANAIIELIKPIYNQY